MKLLYIDLFCGAGGTSTGVNSARINGKQCAQVISCVNHDANAIASHAANHPEALHFTEDIRTLELAPLVEHLNSCKIKHPEALTVLWASLECTNFSRAKGGQPRDADSRTLAEHLFRYIEALNPDYIQIENVEEFMSWGELDKHGKPLSRDKGALYLRWVENVKKYGYDFEYRILNAADYGAYTSRKRYFGIFAKYGLPIAFPQPTHAREVKTSLFCELSKWKSVKDVLDLDDEGESIFDRKKPLSPNTLERIYAGLIKFVAGGKDAFMLKYNSVNKKTGKHIPPSVDAPCPTVAAQARLGIIKCNFLSKYFGANFDDQRPPRFVDMQYGNGTPSSVYNPAPTVTTNPKHQLVTVVTTDKTKKYDDCKDDFPAMEKIKQFMRLYGISDIKMRMLKIIELKRIMGFPEDYVLIGTQADQKKFIGNAVEVNMSRVLCEALVEKITTELLKTA